MKVLVVSPHPDDEVLGVGGTIARLAGEGHEITVTIVTKGWEPLFPESQVKQVRTEAKAANELLGVKSLRFMDLPVTKLNQVPTHELNEKFERLIHEEKPGMVFLPFYGDRHEDHRQVFHACMVALRPVIDQKHVQRILCYETVSETHWSTAYIELNFEPQLWVDISKHLPTKLEAMQKYQSQLRPEPDARSLEALESLAKWRGSMVGMHAAECFVVARECWHK
ncbi:MAG: PIG-L family deacetylase [Candidatus Aminicenantes bacterium]|nr:PIG-L family deacetylase [Candidatus Aminicenantes bacterium]NIM81978.1 PIG-L family deacetylase [Candidatus Aminicenantes bacterium]NIN19327.1 PIG-L family deacetylase [Candidatus Aminicenantes bacterium]NIN43229.1 PIG-L family deacetylase [Candidatus Aminicenantes bacterium]NIN85968.1 PIG-L family deacetylase [Candidatus Aminicenantes bacterium]